MGNGVYVDDRYLLALARSLALKGLPVPGASEDLLVLSDTEHADNLEAALKSEGLWRCPPIWHCCNSSQEVQDECRKGLSGLVPLRGKKVGDVALTKVTFRPPLEDGSTAVHLYLRKPKTIRVKRKLTRDEVKLSLKDVEWTSEALRGLKRPKLMVLAQMHGIGACNTLSNEKLQKALARKLGLS